MKMKGHLDELRNMSTEELGLAAKKFAADLASKPPRVEEPQVAAQTSVAAKAPSTPAKVSKAAKTASTKGKTGTKPAATRSKTKPAAKRAASNRKSIT